MGTKLWSGTLYASGTYGYLKAAISGDLNRGTRYDPDIPDFIEQVVREKQREFFYSTPVQKLVTTRTGIAQYLVPPDLVSIDRIRMNYANTWNPLVKVTFDYLLDIDTNIPPTISVPTLWAPWDDQYRLYAVPNAPYDLELTGKGRIPIPASDGAANFWTAAGADYIRTSTLAHIYARRIKDYQQAQVQEEAARRAKVALVRETIDKTCDHQAAMHLYPTE